MLITQNHQLSATSILASLRGVVPMRRVSSYEVRRLCELQAATLRAHLGNSFDPFFDETKLASLPRIRVEVEPNLPTSGMSLWDGERWVLAINSSEAVTRQRFTLLHEFHHVIAHGVRDRLFGIHSLVGAHSDEAEGAADYFAACVLMPKMLVKRHWGRGPRTVTQMAELFGVSRKAMAYRLEDLGLLLDSRRCSWVREARAMQTNVARAL